MGKYVFILFYGFNALMVLWLFDAMVVVEEVVTKADMNDSAVAIGTKIGAGIVFTFIIMFWALGSVVTGLLALMTRPSKKKC